ncbi:hypothetical protein PanWU01x14_328560 [Parasponia andersonii]|uniref:Uncharacterized protein n=1 Tax=Parasponia andersonii TaxID=3476 RepID=A0A2P5AIN4_PARAD|nr:hypothetical protein PanWU01x14_328560 [Parasponia andersonii]
MPLQVQGNLAFEDPSYYYDKNLSSADGFVDIVHNWGSADAFQHFPGNEYSGFAEAFQHFPCNRYLGFADAFQHFPCNGYSGSAETEIMLAYNSHLDLPETPKFLVN